MCIRDSFPTGYIQIDQNQMQKSQTFEILYLKIAVGKSFCIPKTQENRVDNFKLPFGFDSIYYYVEDEDQSSNLFRHDYVIFDNAQVLPIFIIHFTFDQAKEDALQPPICDVCGENPASVYCKSDDAVLCYDCDDEQHTKGGKLVGKHQRVPLSEKPKSFGNCQTHPDAKLELFCTHCNIPLCVYCKINGTHSTGDAAGHLLVKITDAYKTALADSKECDPQLEKKKNQLAEQLQLIDQKIKDVNTNASQQTEKIYEILQETIQQLQSETQKKMSFLIGDQLELKRLYDQIQWVESFLKYQQDVLNPADYLNAWSRHRNLRKEILKESQQYQITNVQSDMRVVGKLMVVTNESRYNMEDNYNSPDKAGNLQDKTTSDSMDQSQQPGQLGTTQFRSGVFSKNQKQDKNQALIKSLINQSSYQKSQLNPGNEDQSQSPQKMQVKLSSTTAQALQQLQSNQKPLSNSQINEVDDQNQSKEGSQIQKSK
eukprot:TRINITY_DN3461_c0_g2_i2.p1 TRINITY_DN3461_c0_g2~~TRINITY_DN3461_c0_g2_i2.p1  ORF type:complete len:495 (-),score=76.17 TRINITY_DN3461_c0_g2_i2:559-2013(-)